MTDLKDRATTDRLAKTSMTFRRPLHSYAQDVTLKRDVARVRVQPGSAKHLPPLEYAVDTVEVRCSWRDTSRRGDATITLRVRLILGNGALCGNQGTLFLHQLKETPRWLYDLLGQAFPKVDREWEVK